MKSSSSWRPSDWDCGNWKNSWQRAAGSGQKNLLPAARCRLPAEHAMRLFGLGGIFLSFLLLLAPPGCSSSANISEHAPLVRVCILSNQEQVIVASSGRPTIKSANETEAKRLS